MLVRTLFDAPRLTRRTESSYSCDAPAAVIDRLIGTGWHSLPTRSPHEMARLQSGPGLIVAYQTGSILVQGRDPQVAHTALALVCEVAR